MGKYDDIINLPYHGVTTRKRLPIEARAAQFAPFAALTGHKEAIDETARHTERKCELSDYEKEKLSQTLNTLACNSFAQAVRITYYIPDQSKEGGRYISADGFVKRIDTLSRTIRLASGITIPLDDIYRIEHIDGANDTD